MYCRSSSTGEKFEKGTLEWDETPVGGMAKASCKYNRNNNTAIAYRYCLMNTTTMTQYWGEAHDENCSALEKDTSMEKLTKVLINIFSLHILVGLSGCIECQQRESS